MASSKTLNKFMILKEINCKMNIRFCTLLLLCLLALSGFAQKKRSGGQPDLPSFESMTAPPAPDYSLGQNWAALPFREDAADAVPRGVESVSDSDKQVDVFFIHPTVYNKGNTWNADVGDAAINRLVDKKPIKYQASAWNGSCRVYAPRYRQANLRAFYTDKPDGGKALDLAYEDVKKAFQYYLDHYNNGRPIVIASHSQGSRHARRLMADFFDKTPLRNKLVCAYIIGFPSFEKSYTNIKACKDETQTGCIVGWASYRASYEPPGMDQFYGDAICINPVTWRADTLCSNISDHKGMVLFKFSKLIPNKATAEVHKNILWVKIDSPLAKKFNNLHIADINLFWRDIREDVKKRIGYYWKH